MTLRLVAWLAAMSLALPAWAEPAGTASAVAEALFREGKRLMAEGRYPEACSKLAESLRLERAAGTLLNLAVCHEREGKLATAWAEFSESLGLARAAGRADRERLALERLAAIERRLCFVTIVVPEAALEDLELVLDGVVLGRAIWGTPVPVDPGPHRLQARASGRRSWEVVFRLAAAERQTLRVPALGQETAPPLSRQVERASRLGRRRTVSLVLAGVAVTALAVTAGFGVRAIRLEADSDASCDGNRCSPEGLELNRKARDAATVANVGLGVGVAALAAATYLWVTGARPRERRVSVVPAGAGLGVGGVF